VTVVNEINNVPPASDELPMFVDIITGEPNHDIPLDLKREIYMKYICFNHDDDDQIFGKNYIIF